MSQNPAHQGRVWRHGIPPRRRVLCYRPQRSRSRAARLSGGWCPQSRARPVGCGPPPLPSSPRGSARWPAPAGGDGEGGGGGQECVWSVSVCGDAAALSRAVVAAEQACRHAVCSKHCAPALRAPLQPPELLRSTPPPTCCRSLKCSRALSTPDRRAIQGTPASCSECGPAWGAQPHNPGWDDATDTPFRSPHACA